MENEHNEARISVKAVLLDIDGTLLLSNDAHARAYMDAAQRLGVPAAWETVRRLIGKGGDKLIPEAFGIDAESELGRQLDHLKKDIFQKQYLPSTKPAPGGRDLLLHLRRQGIQLTVATSSGKEDVVPLLQQAGVADLIQETTSSDDADASKPEPDIVQAALDRAGVDRTQAVMLGDTPYDVEAARRAGVPVICVRCGGWADRDLQGAMAVYDNPADVLAHIDSMLAAA
jgi:HAD superfamily hydrolase (TIGR01509 family)